jgi:glycosyltransferase involved in cell wall biosynthesis
MRVALVGPYPADSGLVTGGVEASFVNLVQGLEAFDDLDLHVVTFTPETQPEREVPLARGRVRYVPAPTRLNNLTLYRAQRRLLRAALDDVRPDVVHAQDALGYGYVCLRAARREPVVVSIHGIVRETRKWITPPRDRLQVTLAGVPVEAYCVRRARYLLQPTTYPQEYFDGEIRGRIVDVGNGVQDAFFDLDREPEHGRLLYAGAVSESKRVLDLVDAFASVRPAVPGSVLRIAGAADGDYARRVEERVAAHGLSGAVTLLGRLRTDELLDEYRRAAVFVLASAQETSPMVIAESMAAGVPVVATRVGGIPHLVEDGRTGFLVGAGDVTGLAQRVSDLLADERRRAGFGRAAQERARRRFAVAEVAARVREVYREACASSSSTRR